MSVYNDMASDAGYRRGSDENAQLAASIEEAHRQECMEDRFPEPCPRCCGSGEYEGEPHCQMCGGSGVA